MQRDADTAIFWLTTASAGGWRSYKLRSPQREKRIVDLAAGESFALLGFEFRRILSRQGVWRPQYTPRLKKRTALLEKLKEIFRSRKWVYPTLGLYDAYRVRRPCPLPTAAPA